MYGFERANEEYEKALFFPYDDYSQIDREEYEETMADYELEEMRLFAFEMDMAQAEAHSFGY